MRKKKFIIFIVGVILLIIISLILIMSKINSDMNRLINLDIKDIDLTTIQDGRYKGGYKVFPIDVEVEVIIYNHVISDINLIKHTNGQGQHAEEIPKMVIEAQSLEIDIVSGATYSSKVILKAIENALSIKNY